MQKPGASGLAFGIALLALATVAWAFRPATPTAERRDPPRAQTDQSLAEERVVAVQPSHPPKLIAPIEWQFEFGQVLQLPLDWLEKETVSFKNDPTVSPTLAGKLEQPDGSFLIPAGHFVPENPENIFVVDPEAVRRLVAGARAVQGRGPEPACAIQPVIQADGVAQVDGVIGYGGPQGQVAGTRAEQLTLKGLERYRVRAELLASDLARARPGWWDEGYVGSVVTVQELQRGQALLTLEAFPRDRGDVSIVGTFDENGSLRLWAQPH